MTDVKLVVAVNPDGVIAVNGQIPWRKPEDMKRFKRVTMGSTLLMGRKTWESMGRRHLPGRKSVVLSRTPQADVTTFSDLEDALKNGPSSEFPNISVIGGGEVYEAALPFVTELDVTVVTDYSCNPTETGVTLFKSFVSGLSGWKLADSNPNDVDTTLLHRRYTRT